MLVAAKVIGQIIQFADRMFIDLQLQQNTFHNSQLFGGQPLQAFLDLRQAGQGSSSVHGRNHTQPAPGWQDCIAPTKPPDRLDWARTSHGSRNLPLVVRDKNQCSVLHLPSLRSLPCPAHITPQKPVPGVLL